MPIRRKLRPQRKYRKRRYGMRGKWAVQRPLKVHTFKECFPYPSTISAAGLTAQGGITSVNFNMITNAANLKGTFDLYRITGMKLKIMPRYNNADVLQNGALPAGALPLLHIAPNRDPYVPTPTTVADVLNDDGVRTYRLDKPVSLYLKSPKPDLRTGDESQLAIPFQFGASRKFQPWLTTGGNAQLVDQSGINHYGFRWVMDNTADIPVSAQVFVTLYFQMKEQD